MAKPKFTAKFNNGTTLTRSSDRAYTHAWLATGTMTGTRTQTYAAEMGREVPTTWDISGFASSEALAQRALATELKRRGPGGYGGQYIVTFSEVVAVEGGAK